MSMQIPSFPSDSFADPITDAYAWVINDEDDYLNWLNPSGKIVVGVWRKAADSDAGCKPIERVAIHLGEVLVEAAGKTPAVVFSTLSEIKASATAVQNAAPKDGNGNPTLSPFDSLRTAIYVAITALHPKFAEAKQVP